MGKRHPSGFYAWLNTSLHLRLLKTKFLLAKDEGPKTLLVHGWAGSHFLSGGSTTGRREDSAVRAPQVSLPKPRRLFTLSSPDVPARDRSSSVAAAWGPQLLHRGRTAEPENV